MKLKQKLAHEYIDKVVDHSVSLKEMKMNDFLAGFEKAREMAVFIAVGLHTGTDWKVGHDIINMGEEDVE